MKKTRYILTACLFIFMLIMQLISRSEAKIPDIVLSQKSAVVTIHILDRNGVGITTGTGFIVESNGVIATNYHVIYKWLENMFSTLSIKMENGADLPIKELVNLDKERDIAIFKVEAKNLTTVKMARSYKPKQGDGVVVIGSPLGLETTVSDGIISSIRGKGNLIQITAPVSPGSSGSPVFNQKGEVIGIATFLLEGGQNLNFAIPVKYVKEFLPETQTPRQIEKPFAKTERSENDKLSTRPKNVKPLERSPVGKKSTKEIWEIVSIEDTPLKNVVDKTPKFKIVDLSSDVRLKENSWIRIVSQSYVEIPPEEFYKNLTGDLKKNMIETGPWRSLDVIIQFKNPCKAIFITDIAEEMQKKYSHLPNNVPVPIDKYTDIMIYQMAAVDLYKQGKEKERKKLKEEMLKKYPDAEKIWEEYYSSPKFKCDYRIKVFVTYYNSLGIEINTEGKEPYAKWGTEGIKTQIVPGEKTDLFFRIPDGATYGHVWVPK